MSDGLYSHVSRPYSGAEGALIDEEKAALRAGCWHHDDVTGIVTAYFEDANSCMDATRVLDMHKQGTGTDYRLCSNPGRRRYAFSITTEFTQTPGGNVILEFLQSAGVTFFQTAEEAENAALQKQRGTRPSAPHSL